MRAVGEGERWPEEFGHYHAPSTALAAVPAGVFREGRSGDQRYPIGIDVISDEVARAVPVEYVFPTPAGHEGIGHAHAHHGIAPCSKGEIHVLAAQHLLHHAHTVGGWRHNAIAPVPGGEGIGGGEVERGLVDQHGAIVAGRSGQRVVGRWCNAHQRVGRIRFKEGPLAAPIRLQCLLPCIRNPESRTHRRNEQRVEVGQLWPVPSVGAGHVEHGFGNGHAESLAALQYIGGLTGELNIEPIADGEQCREVGWCGVEEQTVHDPAQCVVGAGGPVVCGVRVCGGQRTQFRQVTFQAAEAGYAIHYGFVEGKAHVAVSA